MKYHLSSLMKFSIRDLLWLTVVVALAVGWSLDRSRWREEARADEAEKGLLEEMVAAAKARADFEATFAKAQAARTEAAELARAAARSEAQVHGYNLLSPSPNTPKP